MGSISAIDPVESLLHLGENQFGLDEKQKYPYPDETVPLSTFFVSASIIESITTRWSYVRYGTLLRGHRDMSISLDTLPESFVPPSVQISS